MTDGRKSHEVVLAVELRVRMDPRQDPVAIEHAVAEEGRRAARELYQEVARALEEAELVALGGARQRLESRWVATLMGRIRLSRYRVRVRGRSYHPLDRILGLQRAEASPALRTTVHQLVARLPLSQAADIVGRITGEPMSPQTAWRLSRTVASESE